MRALTIAILSFLIWIPGFAQQQLGLHFMPRTVRSQQTNPAFMNEKMITIGLPSIFTHGEHSGFALGDLLVKVPGSDSLRVDVPNALTQLKADNIIRAGVQADILAVAVKIKGLQVSLSAGARSSAYINYPKSLVELGWNGNAQYIGESVNVGPDIHAFAYSEIALGGAMRFFDKLQVGARLKYLIGMADFSVASRQATLTTQPEFYQLHLKSNYQINTSVFDSENIDELADLSELELKSDFSPMSANKGLAVDLGATFKLSDRIQIAASVVDLGFINWTDQVGNYALEGEVEFEGLDVAQWIDGEEVETEELIDSLTSGLSIRQTGDRYRTQLPTKFYLSGTFSPIKSLRLGGVYYHEVYRGRHFPALAVSASKDLGKWMTGGLTYSIQNGQFDNLGANLLFKLGPMVLFVVTDHVLAPVRPMQKKAVNARFGLEVAF